MTKTNVYVKYSPNTIDVSNAVIEQLDIWKRTTDGIGRFKVRLKNDAAEWLNRFLADDPVEIKIQNTTLLKGYLDQGLPLSVTQKDAFQQLYDLLGRDYGQDLQNKLVNKTGTWMYKTQPADDIIADMLTKASSEITFTSPHTAPEMSYTESGDEYLIEAFRKIAEKINYDFYVDITKAFHFFPIGTLSSGITLKAVAGAVDNNILRLERKEFDATELRNYLLVKGGDIDDGWTEGNATDWWGIGGTPATDEFVIVKRGAASIKMARGVATYCELNIQFPKYNYDYLPFDIFGAESLPFWWYLDCNDAGYGYYVFRRIVLEDTNGSKIVYPFLPLLRADVHGFYKQEVVPIGKSCKIATYNGGNWGNDQWAYFDGTSSNFNWRIKRITFWSSAIYNSQQQINNMYLDGLGIPLPMVSYVQNAESEGLYKVRHYSTVATDIKTQKELDEYAASQTAKRKDPVKGLKITAVGSAGIISGQDKWIPGYTVTVNAPGDGINATYRIIDVHLLLSEEEIMNGYDFIAEVELVPYDAQISGARLGYSKDPQIALFRGLSDRIRFIEKTEELKYDFFPPLAPNAAEKIKVGDFTSLSETMVAWTRRWEENTFKNVHADGVVVDDASAANDKALEFSTSVETILTTLFESPDVYDELSGEFYAIFAVKVSDRTSTSVITKLRLLASAQVRGILYLTPNMLPVANQWHHFAVRARIEANDTNVHIDMYQFDPNLGANLRIDYVGLLPANVPLGYTNVTIVDGTQNTTAGDATQNTTAGDATQNTTAGDATQNTAAQQGFMDWTLIIDRLAVSYSLPDAWTELWNGTSSSVTDAIDFAIVEVEISQESGGPCDIFFEVGVGSNVMYDMRKDILNGDAWRRVLKVEYAFKYPTQNQLYGFYIKKTGNATVATVRLRVWTAKKHTHAMTNPSHSTGMTNPAHSTGTTNPSHATGVTNPTHGHGSTNPTHEQ